MTHEGHIYLDTKTSMDGGGGHREGGLKRGLVISPNTHTHTHTCTHTTEDFEIRSRWGRPWQPQADHQNLLCSPLSGLSIIAQASRLCSGVPSLSERPTNPSHPGVRPPTLSARVFGMSCPRSVAKAHSAHRALS